MTHLPRPVGLTLAGLCLAVTLAGCGAALTAPGATPTAVPTAAPPVPEAFRPLTATPSPTADIQATIAAAIQATRAAEPTATATATATAIPPTATSVPPTVTPLPATAIPAPKPPAAPSTPAINPAERAYVEAWDAIRGDISESMIRVDEGGRRTGNATNDWILGRKARLTEYARWPGFDERVKALAPPPRLQAAHALRVEAAGHLVAAGTALRQVENLTGAAADLIDARAHNHLITFRALTVKAAAESKKVGW